MQNSRYGQSHHYNNYKQLSQLYKLTQASPATSRAKPAKAGTSPSQKTIEKSLSTQSSSGQLDSPNESMMTSYGEAGFGAQAAG